MKWRSSSIFLSAVSYGEISLIVHVFAEEYGCYHGFVYGGQSRKQRGVWQEGAVLDVRWKTRLTEQIGTMTAEIIVPVASGILSNLPRLSLLRSACALVDRSLPERVPHVILFREMHQLLLRLLAIDVPFVVLLQEYILWEITLLRELGFALDLTRCAVTGEKDDLLFVSPRTGRAISTKGAGDWTSRLFILPPFLTKKSAIVNMNDLINGLRLTGHFLERNVFVHRNGSLPNARQSLVNLAANIKRKTVPIM